MEAEAIIFDFGGVLITIDYNATIKAFEKLGVDQFDNLYSQAMQSQLFDDFETGKISAQRFINYLLEYLPSGTSPNQVVHAWNAMILNVPVEGVELLKELKRQGKRTYLLSNTNEIHIQLALNKWKQVTDTDFYSLFNKVYLSHEINLRKPDPDIFRLVCDEQSLIPDKTLFIDDSIQHIEGAKAIGLKTYHLEDQKDLYSLFS